MRTLTVLLLTLLMGMSHGFASVAATGIETSLALAAEKNKAPVSDDAISDFVRLKLASDADVKGGSIAVDVKNGVVTLSGLVDTERALHKAERLAKHVKGVKSVVNQLKLKE